MKFCHFVLNILSQNEISACIKGHYSVTNVLKIRCNNPKLEIVNMNAYINFGEILSICSQAIERKRNYEGQNDRNKDGRNDGKSKSPTFSKWGYNDIPVKISSVPVKFSQRPIAKNIHALLFITFH